MIYDLHELNNTVYKVANRIIETAAAQTTDGTWEVDHNDFADLISYEDFLQYSDFIVSELLDREQILDIDVRDHILHCSMDTKYCPQYQHKLDVEGFPVPIRHPLSQIRLAEIGEQAIPYVLETSDMAIEDLTESLGMSVSELQQIGIYDSDDSERGFAVGNDFYIGKWRVHYAPPGSRYGTQGQLVNDETCALVEFYDMSQNKDRFPTGQFTGGLYFVSTILANREYPKGFHLDADIASWTVSGEEMREVLIYLKGREDMRTQHRSLIDQIYEAESRGGNPDHKNMPDQKGPER